MSNSQIIYRAEREMNMLVHLILTRNLTTPMNKDKIYTLNMINFYLAIMKQPTTETEKIVYMLLITPETNKSHGFK